MTLLIAIFWGGFGAEHIYIAVGTIMAWGPGDAVAAIVEKRNGKHKLQGERIEGVKSVEGSIGMVITSFASLTELYTKGGWDTVTVPIVSALILCGTLFWG